MAKRFPVVVKVASFQHPSTHNIRPKTCMSVIISHLEFWFYHMNSRSRLKGRGRDMDFLLVVVPSSHRETAVCSYRFVCNVVLCRLGWYVDRVIITGHCWTQVRNTKKSGSGFMLLSSLLSSWLWIRYWYRANEIISPVFFKNTLISALDPCFGVPCTKAEVCYRIADQPWDLCCTQQDLSEQILSKLLRF